MGNEGVGFDPINESVFTELELQLRHTVEMMLSEQVGPQWMKLRVPDGMLLRWESRRDEERSAGRSVLGAIHYSNFMDLLEIICRPANWRDTFKTVFRNKDDVKASFRRLLPVRRALRHSRPLGRTDVLYLYSEATRLFAAMKVQVVQHS